MSELYRLYATVTNATSLAHAQEVERTAAQFARVLLPTLRQGGLGLERARVLEFGAGWGRNLLALRSLGATALLGVDASEEQVALGRRLGVEGLELVSANESLPEKVGSEAFDVVLAIDVLEHLPLPELERMARELPRLLRPGGFLVVQVPNDLAPLSPIRAGDLTHLRAFTGESVVQFLRLCGLEPVLVRGVAFPGSGLLHRARDGLARWVLWPAMAAASRVLYGRADAFGIHAPNILAVGQRRGTP